MSMPYLAYPGQVDLFSYLNIGFFTIICRVIAFFVPKMYYARSWTEPDIYEYFGLSDGEIQLFETAMWPMLD